MSDPRGVSFLLFLAFWTLMMMAMMFPSVAPTAITWSNYIARNSKGFERNRRTIEFLFGYLVAWAVYGAFAFGALYAVAEFVERHPEGVRWIGAGLLLFAGLYQLTPVKRVCLRHCRSPLMFLVQHASLTQPMRDLRVGLHHGLFCVGCCWGLMVVLLTVGIMNVGAMIVVAIVVCLEKLWLHGELLAKALGFVFLAFSVAVAAYPTLVAALNPGISAPMRM